MTKPHQHLLHPHVGSGAGSRPFIGFGLPLDNLPAPSVETTSTVSIPWSDLVPLLDQIPPREADIVELIVLRGKNQRDVAEVLEMTQGGVSYALHRACYRLMYLARKPKLTVDEVRELLRPILTPKQLQVITTLWDNPSQSSAGRLLGWSQGWVRHHLEYGLEDVQAWLQRHPEATEVATVYEHLDWTRREKAWSSLVFIDSWASRKQRKPRANRD